MDIQPSQFTPSPAEGQPPAPQKFYPERSRGANKKLIIALVIILALLAIGAGAYFWQTAKTPMPVACTQEAKQCPDGSYVSRTGPNCEFAACPEVKPDETANWQTYSNAKYGFEVKYPNNKNYNVSEINPNFNQGDKFLLHIDMVRNDGGFAVEITISENINKQSDINSLQSAIVKWYGTSNWPFDFPTAGAKIKEFDIDNYPAIRSDYIAKGEGSVADPAVQIFTLNSQYIYKIDYVGDIKEGDQILSTFKFTSSEPTASWQTYRNDEYRFQIKYPPKYKTAEDKSGWPHSLVLFVEKSGYAQSYDIAIELWNNQSDWEKDDHMQPSLIREIGNKYLTITFWNLSKEEINQILSTFKFTP